jgi:putative Holliday junction resolvase
MTGTPPQDASDPADSPPAEERIPTADTGIIPTADTGVVTQSEPEPFPRSGRLAGVDFGSVRIGVSVCDPLWILVSPLEIRLVSDPARDAEYFRALAKREALAGWVVGLPIHCDGGESQKSIEARSFAKWLQESTFLPVRLFDERFTTSDAQARLRASSRRIEGNDRAKGKSGGKSAGGKSAMKRSRQRQVDAIAAQVLLESFLEAVRYARNRPLPGQAPDRPATGGEALN